MTHQMMELYDYHLWANTMKKNRFIDQPHMRSIANEHTHVPIRAAVACVAEPAAMIWERRWEGGLVQWM